MQDCGLWSHLSLGEWRRDRPTYALSIYISVIFYLNDSRPVGLALYGRLNRKSGVTPEAEYSGIDAPTRGVVNI
eukprot:5270510-Pleurochrysis_carterae.AAC.1